jgi:acetate kinase
MILLLFQTLSAQPIRDHRAAFLEVLNRLADPKDGAISDISAITVVGHRVVHGGEISKAAVIDDQALARKLSLIAYEHCIHYNPSSCTNLFPSPLAPSFHTCLPSHLPTHPAPLVFSLHDSHHYL